MKYVEIWLREIARWVYWFPLRWLVHRLPLRLGRFIGYQIGILSYYAANRRRKRLFEGVKELLGKDLDERSIRRIVRETFDHTAKNAVENLLCDKLDRRIMERMIEWEGLENLDRALSYDRGAILMHGHLGNEELIMPAVGFKGYCMNQLASRWKPDAVDGQLLRIPNLIRQKIFELKIGTREKYPVRFIYIDKSLRKIFECLRRNEVLAVAMDGREGSKWITVEFLGKKVILSPGPMHIALTTKAPVVPVFILRGRKNSRHRLVFHEIFTVVETGDKQRDIVFNTQNFVRLLEGYVRKYPCHYMKLFWVNAEFFVDDEGMVEQ